MKRRSPRAIELAVIKAANQAPWLEPSDQAALRVAKRLAETLDTIYSAADSTLLGDASAELASKTTYTAQTLLRVLEQLGLTAQSRDALGFGTRPAAAGDPLAEIRQALADVVALPSAADAETG